MTENIRSLAWPILGIHRIIDAEGPYINGYVGLYRIQIRERFHDQLSHVTRRVSGQWSCAD